MERNFAEIAEKWWNKFVKYSSITINIGLMT